MVHAVADFPNHEIERYLVVSDVDEETLRNCIVNEKIVYQADSNGSGWNIGVAKLKRNYEGILSMLGIKAFRQSYKEALHTKPDFHVTEDGLHLLLNSLGLDKDTKPEDLEGRTLKVAVSPQHDYRVVAVYLGK